MAKYARNIEYVYSYTNYTKTGRYKKNNIACQIKTALYQAACRTVFARRVELHSLSVSKAERGKFPYILKKASRSKISV